MAVLMSWCRLRGFTPVTPVDHSLHDRARGFDEVRADLEQIASFLAGSVLTSCCSAAVSTGVGGRHFAFSEAAARIARTSLKSPGLTKW